MNFLHYEFDAGPGDVIEVTLDHAANVQLLTPAEYASYRNGQAYRYHGGHVTQSPSRIRPPHRDHWHVVIDLGGASGTLRAAAQLLAEAAA